MEIINLGIEPDEALQMELSPEKVDPLKDKQGRPQTRPVASYVSPQWAKWLQTQRVELNAMTSPQFIEWLDSKMSEHESSKFVPPEDVLIK